MALQFQKITDYALRHKLRALIDGILEGAVIPAPEQPCWDCGRLRYFWYNEGMGWVEQCLSRKVGDVK